MTHLDAEDQLLLKKRIQKDHSNMHKQAKYNSSMWPDHFNQQGVCSQTCVICYICQEGDSARSFLLICNFYSGGDLKDVNPHAHLISRWYCTMALVQVSNGLKPMKIIILMQRHTRIHTIKFYFYTDSTWSNNQFLFYSVRGSSFHCGKKQLVIDMEHT